MKNCYLYTCLQNLPPVRSSAATNSRKPRKKKQKKRSDPVKPASRIHSYDYKAWDNFDVVSSLRDFIALKSTRCPHFVGKITRVCKNYIWGRKEKCPLQGCQLYTHKHLISETFLQEKACDEVDYEVESYSGSEEERGEEEGRGEEEEEEEGEGGGSAGVSSEEEEMERQRAMAVAEKEKVLFSGGYLNLYSRQ